VAVRGLNCPFEISPEAGITKVDPLIFSLMSLILYKAIRAPSAAFLASSSAYAASSDAFLAAYSAAAAFRALCSALC
jgi:hypothetical protein